MIHFTKQESIAEVPQEATMKLEVELGVES